MAILSEQVASLSFYDQHFSCSLILSLIFSSWIFTKCNLSLTRLSWSVHTRGYDFVIEKVKNQLITRQNNSQIKLLWWLVYYWIHLITMHCAMMIKSLKLQKRLKILSKLLTRSNSDFIPKQSTLKTAFVLAMHVNDPRDLLLRRRLSR